MATSASTTVFADFDLLEDILLHLPLQDLLLTERVCKQWQGMQQTSSRVRKALFLEPFHAQKIYYPTASKPWWYLVPGHAELQQQGFLGEDDPDNNQVSYPATSTQLETVPGSGSSEGSDSSGGSDVTVCNLIQDKHYLRPSSSSSKKKKDVLGSSRLYDHDTVNPNPVIPKGPPADKKMLVSRIASGPFFNPFAEKFRKSNPPIPCSAKQSHLTPSPTPVYRYWISARGTWYDRPDEWYPNPKSINQKDREAYILPPKRTAAGTIWGSSHRTHAVELFSASWRRMVPFSATTTSFEVECFDNGDLEVYDDEGLTAGDMMEQLGRHWGNVCPDCCIFDYWFAEFVKYCCHTDHSYWNRGEHGVRKLALDNTTGWDALSEMYEADIVAITGVKERHRPY